MLSFRNTKRTGKNVADTTFKHKEIINFVENEAILQNDKLIVHTFNYYFCNIVKHLSVPKDPCFEDQTSNFRVKTSIEKCKDHPNIIFSKDKISSINNPKLSFNFASVEQTLD